MLHRLMLILLLSALLPSATREAKAAPAPYVHPGSSGTMPSLAVHTREHWASPSGEPSVATGLVLQQIEPEQVPPPLGMWSGLPIPP
jgi:hypothetical protein